MNRVVIGLGSNFNPEENILAVRALLSGKFTVLKESSFLKTKPLDHSLAEEFLNGCVYLQTTLNLESLRAELKRIEREMGRDPEASPHLPHPIDLDVVVWNEKVVDRNFYRQRFLKDAVLQLLPGLEF